MTFSVVDLKKITSLIAPPNTSLTETTREQYKPGLLRKADDAAQATGTCSLTLNRVDVSGCYSISGVSKATISVEVGWQNAPTDEDIVVSTAGQSVTITPGSFTVTYPQPTATVIKGRQTIVTPQVVAFEVTLSGAASSSSVTAQFSGTPACVATQTYALPAACPPTPCSGQLGGIVFRDFNADGTQQATETQGVASVTVTAYDCNGTQYGPVTTDQFGKYTFTSATIKYPVRVEFTDPKGVDVATIYGANSKSNVQFVSQADCSVDLGIANPTLYCQADPLIFIPCYTYGDPLDLNPTPAVSATALSANADALVSFPYDESNTAATGMTHIAEAGVMGTVWGLGYNRLTKDLFVGAALHRHAGLGPLGIGGIYVTHTASATVTTQNFIKLSDLGVDVGDALVPVNGATGRGLSADKTKPSHDAAVFSLIGKVGIGGLEIAEDGQSLWFVNLFDKKLYSINLSAYNTSGTLPTSADVKSYAIPDPACTGGSSRPWALHVSGGKFYVGTVCDALTSQNKSEMRAYVYAFDPTTTTFASIFDFPLTYPKGYGISPLNSPGQNGADSPGWFPWTDSFDDLVIPTSTAVYKSLVHPQPMLADIEFDVDGSMVLGFADRTGLQGGYNNYSTDPTDVGLYTVNPAAGDILRAYYSNGSYILENNGKVGPFTGTGVNNNQGPGFGEFYDDNYFDGSKFAHTELALGGLALKPGSGHVVGATIDPVATKANSGGVKYWNNETGVAEAAAIVYSTGTDPGTFAKAAGLGELDLNCDLLQVIEIGNRVWVDTDKDGIQDPCEKALAGVEVDLYKGTTKVASTTTNAAGEYYFSSKSKLTTGTWLGTGADTTLIANTAYSLVFGAGQFSNNILTVNGSKLDLTGANSTASQANDLNDSDASVATVAGITAPVISLTTGNTGFVNHNFDVGFSCEATTVASVSVTPATCNTATQTGRSNGKIELTGIQVADKAFLITTSSIPSYTATGSQPVSSSAVSFTGLANPTSTSGTSYSVVLYNGPCCYTVVSALLPQTDCFIPCDMTVAVTPSVCSSATNTYTVTGTVSLTAARAGTLTITDGTHSTTIAVATNATTAPFSLTGLLSDGLVHTVSVVSSATACGTTSTTYTAPVSCSITPALGLIVTPGTCNSVTNEYTVSGTVSLTASLTGTLTITNGTSTTTVSVTAGQTSATFGFDGLPSGSGLKTVTVSGSGYSPVSATYTAPVSCTVAPLPASLGDYVWYDLNGNGQQDGNETGVAGVTVNLYDPSSSTITPIASLTTDSDGNYLFTNLTAGQYCVIFDKTTLPTGFTLTSANTGTDATDSDANPITGKTTTYTLAAGEQNLTVDAGILPLPASLGDFVWFDTNKNGIQEGTETGVANVTAVLCDATSGTVISTTLTDGSGKYLFTNLNPGSYIVKFTAPTGTTFTSPNTGGDATDSDVASTTGTRGSTGVYSLTAGEQNLTVDAGLIPVTPLLDLVVTAGVCNSLTNEYTLTGTVSLTNAVAATLTITDGTSTTTVSVTVGQSATSFSLDGFISGSGSHTVTVAGSGYTPVSTTYTAPLSCTVCSVSLTTSSLPVGFIGQPYTASLTVSGGTAPYSFSLTGAGSVPSLTLSSTGVFSGTPTTSGSFSLTVLVSDSKNCSAIVLLPLLEIDLGPICSLTATATPGQCNTATNTYTVTGTISLTNNTTGGTLTLTDGRSTTTVSIASNATSVPYSLTGLDSDGLVHTVTATLTGCGTGSVTYTAPESCTTAPGQPTLELEKFVNKSVAQVGDLLTYTVVLTNTSAVSATNVTVSDSFSSGMSYVANSATSPAGTTFTPGTSASAVSTWQVASIAGGQSLTLTFQTVANSSGILYNSATIPGDTARVCTTVPFQICKGTDYAFLLEVAAGRSSYQWYLNGQAITGATSNTYVATQAGSYSLSAGGVSPALTCESGTCCPFIIEEINSVDSFSLTATSPTCTGTAIQTNGTLTVTGLTSLTGLTFELTKGSSFTAGTPITVAKTTISATGLLNSTLTAGTYWVRVYNAAGCFQDASITIIDVPCSCPPAKCIPFVVKKIARTTGLIPLGPPNGR